MRKLTDHIVANSATDQLAIEVHDEPGSGGANHLYAVYGFHTNSNPSVGEPRSYDNELWDQTCLKILFQNGPIKEVGSVNGITQEVLLTIVIDRLRSFQAGQYACRENAIALTHCEDALMWLQKRTRDRLDRGVEGTHTK